MNIKGDSIHIKNFKGIEKEFKMVDTTVYFKLKNNKFVFGGDEIYDWKVKVSKDSMVVIFDTNEKMQVIFRKLPKRSKKIDWNPKGKRYIMEGDGEKLHQDYTNDSIMYSHYVNEIDVYANKWQIENVDNYSFLLHKFSAGNAPLLIDSVSGTNVYLTNYSIKKNNIVLEEQKNVTTKPSKLFGEWKLVSKKEIIEVDGELQYELYSMNNLHKLSIEEDSIKMYNRIWKSRSSWKYYEDEKIILLEMDKQKLIKIVQLTKNELVLEMNLGENMGREKQFVFKRE
ncbi:hypothetical protein H2O64_13590 [Kordia sp. YSTF-M3]|uniref:Uncharacterized protein n=1 Tax=Kordia aestuariivivens TaxID=2759037 RepID=A0ABR7QAZ7_9FLAO|nr:hypothetical protein [Kordia aestuariivivens]MBC8755703.1 hypothetical protein [Kordia aestuariivivens]